MRVAALYDIHGNLPALEAVLQEVEQSGIDQIVVGGDVVLGPMSRECLDRLLEIQIPIHFIQGNCEVAVLAQMMNEHKEILPEKVLEDIHWTAKQLLPAHKELLASWPKTITLEIGELGTIFFCHATPRSQTEIFTRFTPENKLLPIFEMLNVGFVVCGHTHMQFDRRIGKVRVINAGSIGMPFGKPGAYWLLLGPNVELRHTAYDIINAAKLIRKTAYPNVEEFAKNSVLQPPSEDAMLEIFNRAELQT
jgi:putative phosphoesterase